MAGWEHFYSGKVRDLYRSDEFPDQVLMVASDRVSAFDNVLEPGIPGKGELLTQLTLWWFAQLDVPNHLVVPQPSALPSLKSTVQRPRASFMPIWQPARSAASTAASRLSRPKTRSTAAPTAADAGHENGLRKEPFFFVQIPGKFFVLIPSHGIWVTDGGKTVFPLKGNKTSLARSA